ncbi:MAG: RNA polymerase sigma factor RpoD/SigA [Candidatus Paceibacterota bacterium]|jgi:RNA polymerase primary sigma factor
MRSLKITKQITVLESKSFEKYLQEIGKLNRKNSLTAEEEVELAERIKKGDKKAEKELIERNLRFVVSVAKQYQHECCQLEDLVSEGNIGLVTAARRFDLTRGYKFISYAVWWIRQSILCYLSENARSIRLPLNKVGQLNKIKKAQEKFEQIHHRRPSSEEIIETLDFEMSAEGVDTLFMLDKGAQSLNVKISNNGSGSNSEDLTLEDLLIDYTAKAADEDMEMKDFKEIVKKILNKMQPNQKTVIEMYYGLNGGEPRTLDEIANHMDLSRERIRQIKNSAVKVMGSARNHEIVRPYMK